MLGYRIVAMQRGDEQRDGSSFGQADRAGIDGMQ